MINEEGNIVSTYCKTHLFDVEIPEKNVFLKESSYVEKGIDIGAPISTPCGNVALGIVSDFHKNRWLINCYFSQCYDMRFPELSLMQRKLGTDILTFPSAFTVPTGQAHWHVLLRSRAIGLMTSKYAYFWF